TSRAGSPRARRSASSKTRCPRTRRSSSTVSVDAAIRERVEAELVRSARANLHRPKPAFDEERPELVRRVVALVVVDLGRRRDAQAECRGLQEELAAPRG